LAKALKILQEKSRRLDKYGRWNGKVQNTKKYGTPFWCRANVSTLKSSEYGTLWVATHENITESKKMKEALQKS